MTAVERFPDGTSMQVGGRYLIQSPIKESRGLEEVTVVERSPSGTYVLLDFVNAPRRWFASSSLVVVEALKSCTCADESLAAHKSDCPTRIWTDVSSAWESLTGKLSAAIEEAVLKNGAA
jgi:hypothetical protein